MRKAIGAIFLMLFMSTSAFAQRTERPYKHAVYKGAKIGAIAGGAGGAGFGAFVGLLVYGLCDSGDCPEHASGPILVGTLLGGATGAVGGGILGGIIGGSTVHGSATLSPVYASGADSTGSGFGARLTYSVDIKHVSLGPEFGYYKTHEPVWHAGMAARLGTGWDHALEPYASAGVGLYSWNRTYTSTNLGGYHVGGGLQLRNPAGKRTLFGEARWQENLTSSGTSADYGFMTLAAGASISW